MEELIMSDVVAVTNRHLCVRDYFEQIEAVAASGVNKLIVREKDLTPQEYKELFVRVRDICGTYHVEAVPHYFWREASQCGADAIHLPLDVLEECCDKPEFIQAHFTTIGTSVHSVEQAEKACRLGASYVTAGHVFATDCKKGLEPRGLGFLKNICRICAPKGVQVYAIGGISPDNYRSALDAGAAAVCMMSYMMKARYGQNVCRKED